MLLQTCSFQILDFIKRVYGMFPWSMPTVDQRLRYFAVRNISSNTPVSDVVDTVLMELEGGGKG